MVADQGPLPGFAAAKTYFILHPGRQTATVITASGSPRIIRWKDGRWWCDCPHYRDLERQGRPPWCGHVRLAAAADETLTL